MAGLASVGTRAERNCSRFLSSRRNASSFPSSRGAFPWTFSSSSLKDWPTLIIGARERTKLLPWIEAAVPPRRLGGSFRYTYLQKQNCLEKTAIAQPL